MKKLPAAFGIAVILIFTYAAAFICSRNYLSVTVDTSTTNGKTGNSTWSLQSVGWPPSQDHFVNDVFAPAIFVEEIWFDRKVKFGVVRWTWSPLRERPAITLLSACLRNRKFLGR